jgi:hypothetical protein
MDEKEILQRRKNRTIATILGFKERELDDFLPAGVSADFRSLILDQINDLVNLTLDLLAAASGERVINELYYDRLEDKLDEIQGILTGAKQ